jgi:hypothetical protein
MFRDRIEALLRHIPVVGPTEDEFDPFSGERPEEREHDEGDDRVHAPGSQQESGGH